MESHGASERSKAGQSVWATGPGATLPPARGLRGDRMFLQGSFTRPWREPGTYEEGPGSVHQLTGAKGVPLLHDVSHRLASQHATVYHRTRSALRSTLLRLPPAYWWLEGSLRHPLTDGEQTSRGCEAPQALLLLQGGWAPERSPGSAGPGSGAELVPPEGMLESGPPGSQNTTLSLER